MERPRLVRSMQQVFVVESRKRRWITSLQVFQDWGYVWEQVEVIPDEELQRIPRGPDVVAGPVFRDSTGSYWVVLDGQLRRVAGVDAFPVLNTDPARARALTSADRARFPEGSAVGNPPRPWMLAPLAALALAAAAIWWRLPRAWWPLAGVTLVSLALKLYYVSLFPWFPDGPDAMAYYQVSQYFVRGGSLLVRNDDLIGITSPLYPMVLAFLLPLVGHQMVGVKLVQALVATALVPLVAAVGTLLFSRRAGLAAGLVAAVSPVWFYSAELLQYEVWLALALAAAFWCLVRFSRAATARGRGAWLAGGALGLAAATLLQLKAIVLVPAAVAYVGWRLVRDPALTPTLSFWEREPVPLTSAESQREQKPATLTAALSQGQKGLALPNGREGIARRWAGEGRRASVARGIACALAFGLVATMGVGLWGLRNYALYREVILGSTASGVIMWIGNHPSATGGIMQLGRPDAFYDRARRYPEASPTRELRAYADLAREYVRQYPMGFARLALVKLERLWWTLTPDRLGEYTEGRVRAFLGGCCDAEGIGALSKLAQAFTLVTVVLGVLAVVWHDQLGLGGWGFGAGGKEPAAQAQWALLGAIALFCLVHAPFIAEPRYRVPIVPLIQVLQGAGLVVLRDRLRGSEA